MSKHANVMIQPPLDNCFPEDGYHDLANAIICQAVEDYKDIFFGRVQEKGDLNAIEIKKFFGSRWFKCLTKVDGNSLFARIAHDLEEYKQSEN